MLLNILSIITIRIVIPIVFIISPLSLGLWILLISLSLSLTISIKISAWYRILLILIYVGGLLVIFSYFVAIQPNQQLGFLKLILIFLITFLYFILLLISLNTVSFIDINISFFNSSILNPYNIIIILILGIFLFFALIVVVKITYLSKLPLRPFIYVFTHSKIPSCYKNY